MSTDQKYPEILEDLAAKLAADFIGMDFDAPTAARVARCVAERIRKEWGGQKLYIPRGTAYNVERMREEVARRWTGLNTRELCRELDISEMRLRQLADEARRARA